MLLLQMISTFRFIVFYWFAKNIMLITVFSYDCEKFYKIVRDVDEVCYRLLSTNQELGKN